MNKSYDYNGTIVSKSKPQQKLRILKRTLHLNSGDRDYTKYPTNGDFVINLPRSYDNVVAVRVKGAEFPSLYNGTTPLYYKHAYGSTGATFTIDTPLGSTGLFSFYLDWDFFFGKPNQKKFLIIFSIFFGLPDFFFFILIIIIFENINAKCVPPGLGDFPWVAIVGTFWPNEHHLTLIFLILRIFHG